MKITLFQISFSISIIGIFFLLFLSNTLKPKQIEIKDIDFSLTNKKIQINGKIASIKNYENFQVIVLRDRTGEIEVAINSNFNLTKNQNLTVIGTVNQYRSNLQLQAEKILQ